VLDGEWVDSLLPVIISGESQVDNIHALPGRRVRVKLVGDAGTFPVVEAVVKDISGALYGNMRVQVGEDTTRKMALYPPLEILD
jgi:hypothetical protein